MSQGLPLTALTLVVRRRLYSSTGHLRTRFYRSRTCLLQRSTYLNIKLHSSFGPLVTYSQTHIHTKVDLFDSTCHFFVFVLVFVLIVVKTAAERVVVRLVLRDFAVIVATCALDEQGCFGLFGGRESAQRARHDAEPTLSLQGSS
jgi:hypothetical protein